MKLYLRLILILGGASLLIFLIHSAIAMTGISGNSRVTGKAVAFMQEDFLKKHSETVCAGDAAFIRSKFNSFFTVLEYILDGKDTESRIKEGFSILDACEIEYALIEKKGKITCLENPGRTKGAPMIRSSDYQTFLRLIREDVGSRNRAVLAARSYPGFIWVIAAAPGRTAVFRVNGKELLAHLPDISGESPAALVWDSGFVVSCNTDKLPAAAAEKMNEVCGETGVHSGKTQGVETTLLDDEKGVRWSISSARLDAPVPNSTELHVIRAVRSPDPVPQLMDEISDSFSGTVLLLIGAIFLSFLLFLPVLLIVSRHLASQIGEAVSYVREILQSEKRTPGLDLKFSGELAELSGGLNLLRDKLNSALMRLSRSHERELIAKKSAEESNILRSELLKSVLAELRGPLARIDGFSRAIRERAGESPEVAYAAEQIRVENRTMISMFRALSDLTSLNADFCELGSYQIEPSEIIRDAFADLTRRAAENNISVEIQCSASLEEPLTTSPSVLTHTVYTAAATLIRFVPQNSVFRITSYEDGNSLIFRFSDTPSDHLSIAEVFRNYTETGVISEPHCTVAVLNLLILKAEAEYLGAAVEIAKTETANSMIEIRIPILAFNPAVTGVFTRPKLKVNQERASVAARYHVAGIASVALSGRSQSLGSGTVLLTNFAEPDISLYRMILEPEGFSVFSVSGAEELKQMLEEYRYDLLFAEVSAGSQDDCREVAELRRAAASSVIVVFTESGNTECMEKLMSSGADLCFRKPVVAEDLLSALGNLKTGRRDFL